MIVLGIDPGLADTGWGVVEFDGQHYRPVSFGIVTTPAGEDLQKRIYTIGQDLGELASGAIRQVKEKKYDAGITGEVLYVGLAHCGKNVEIRWEEGKSNRK